MIVLEVYVNQCKVKLHYIRIYVRLLYRRSQESTGLHISYSTLNVIVKDRRCDYGFI